MSDAGVTVGRWRAIELLRQLLTNERGESSVCALHGGGECNLTQLARNPIRGVWLMIVQTTPNDPQVCEFCVLEISRRAGGTGAGWVVGVGIAYIHSLTSRWDTMFPRPAWRTRNVTRPRAHEMMTGQMK